MFAGVLDMRFMEIELLYFNKLHVYKRQNLKTGLIVNCARTRF